MNDSWETPADLFDVLHKEFNFVGDAACTEDTCKCTYGYALDAGTDSLKQSWAEDAQQYKGSVWLNPPYSRGNIDKFMGKAYAESLEGVTVVCLVRFDPSTDWFQRWVDDKAAEVRMLARRVKFVGAPSAYNFPTCIVVYKSNWRKAYHEATDYFIWDWKHET